MRWDCDRAAACKHPPRNCATCRASRASPRQHPNQRAESDEPDPQTPPALVISLILVAAAGIAADAGRRWRCSVTSPTCIHPQRDPVAETPGPRSRPAIRVFRLGGMVGRIRFQRDARIRWKPGFKVTDGDAEMAVRLHRYPARPVPREAGGDRHRHGWTAAASSPSRCWPSTTRTTCPSEVADKMGNAHKKHTTYRKRNPRRGDSESGEAGRYDGANRRRKRLRGNPIAEPPWLPCCLNSARFALILALLIAAGCRPRLPLVGALARATRRWMAIARPAAAGAGWSAGRRWRSRS